MLKFIIWIYLFPIDGRVKVLNEDTGTSYAYTSLNEFAHL